MNQHISHSNTPQLSADKSQTTARLYQHPTPAEMKVTLIQKAKAWGQDLFAAAVVLACISTPIFVIRGCAEDVDRQHAQAVQYQAQFGGGK
ncbi:MAG: hypothetical protein ACN6NX_11545 [Acinetobacter sp.]